MAKRVDFSEQASKALSPKRQLPVKSRKTKQLKNQPGKIEAERRLARLVELIDLCAAGRAIADTLDETFLAYLLAMAVQEARSKLRHGTTAVDAVSPSLRG